MTCPCRLILHSYVTGLGPDSSEGKQKVLLIILARSSKLCFRSCTRVYIYTYMFIVFICVYIYKLCIYVYVCVFVGMCMYTYTYVHQYVCIYI